MTNPPTRPPASAEVAAHMIKRAEADATRALDAAAATFGGTPTALTDRAPLWAQPYIARHNDAMDREHYVCEHITGPITAIHIAVWAPGYVCCSDCADIGLLSSLCPPAEAHRCDVCGRDCPPPAGLRHGMLRGGHALIHFGCCDPCNDSGAVTR